LGARALLLTLKFSGADSLPDVLECYTSNLEGSILHPLSLCTLGGSDCLAAHTTRGMLAVSSIFNLLNCRGAETCGNGEWTTRKLMEGKVYFLF
jgi:hypothetical protein